MGGSLSAAGGALEAGAYSFTPSSQFNLRVYYSMTDGDILDSVTGSAITGY